MAVCAKAGVPLITIAETTTPMRPMFIADRPSRSQRLFNRTAQMEFQPQSFLQ
jgi:hypothetical protein